MNYENFNKVKELYDNGFKCIKYEEESEGGLKVYFKNFESEAIKMLTVYEKNEKNEIKNYIDCN